MLNTFRDLHKALRSLRLSRGKTQNDVAEAAGISRAMVSAYENGRKLPAIETLDKILDALDAGLPELNEALGTGNRAGASPVENVLATSGWPQAEPPPTAEWPRVNLYQVLGIDHPLPVDQEYALRQLLAGIHKLVRGMLREVESVTVASGDGPFDD